MQLLSLIMSNPKLYKGHAVANATKLIGVDLRMHGLIQLNIIMHAIRSLCMKVY